MGLRTGAPGRASRRSRWRRVTAVRVVCISDTHDLHRLLPIPEADLLIHAGDLTETGDRDDVRSAMRWLNAQPCRDIVATAGNHDLALRSPSFVRDMRESFPRVQLLIDEGAEISGRKVWGSPWAPMPQTLWAYTAPRGSETLARAWAEIPDDVEVLVTHTPPARHPRLERHRQRPPRVQTAGGALTAVA